MSNSIKGKVKSGGKKGHGKSDSSKRPSSADLTRPATIILFRHAEKPANKTDPNLSTIGETRADRLASYIPATFGKPDFIIAAAVSKGSARPYQTVVPLSRATGVAIDATIRDAHFQKLAERLTRNRQYDGKLVVICWHHGEIPQLMEALGAPAGSYPSQWKKKVFNLILKLEFGDDTGRPVVTQITEPF